MNPTNDEQESQRWMRTAARIAPGLVHRLRCDRSWLRADLMAGVSAAAVALPAGIAYAELTRMPPRDWHLLGPFPAARSRAVRVIAPAHPRPRCGDLHPGRDESRTSRWRRSAAAFSTVPLWSSSRVSGQRCSDGFSSPWKGFLFFGNGQIDVPIDSLDLKNG